MDGVLEVLRESFQPVNLPFTVLMIVVILYWISVILGALDLSFLDVDLDADAGADLSLAGDIGGPDVDIGADVGDVDVAADADASVDGDASADGAGHGFLYGILAFFNATDVPVMILVSILAVSMWLFSMLTNHHLGSLAPFMWVLLLGANFLVCLLILKVVSTPLRSVFRSLQEDPDAARALGSVGVVTTSMVNGKFGQVEVVTNAAPLCLNVRTNGEEIPKGSQVLIYEFDADKHVYLVQTLKTEV